MLQKKWFKIVLLTLFSGSVMAVSSSTFVFNAQNTPDIVRAVDFARDNQKAVVVQGEGTAVSQDNGVVYVNLRDFKQMITLQLKQNTMLVESGMTWNQAQQLVAPFGLSLQFIPAQANEPIFATINHNQTGISPQNPLVADGIDSLRLLQPSGSIVDVSPTKTPQLWRGIFGAQGLLGVVLDVNLKLVKNQNLVRHAERLSYYDYAAYLHDQVQSNPDISASIARMDVAPGKGFLNDLYVVSYWVKDKDNAQSLQLHPVRNNIAQSVYQWSENGDWEKKARWKIENTILGSKVLNPELTRADLLMRQMRTTDDQIHQVYYVPVVQFVPFMDGLHNMATQQKWAFNQVSLRYLAAPSDLMLAPQQGDMVVVAISLSKTSLTLAQQQTLTSMLADLALSHAGSFALNQFTVQDIAKINMAYPQFRAFQQLKTQYDQHNLFVSALYPNVG